MGIRLTFVTPELEATLTAFGLHTYEDFVNCSAGELVSRSGTTQTRRLRIDGELTGYLKVYRYERDRWRHRFRRDKAAVEAGNYRLLRDRCGVDVPDVIAHGARRRGLRLLDAFLLTREVGFHARSAARRNPSLRDDIRRHSAAIPLDAYFAMNWPDPNRTGVDPLRLELLEATAALVRRLHASGFCHIDLQWRNILVLPDGHDRPRLFVIDAPRGGLRRWRLHRLHGQIRDLSSLYKESRTRLRRTEQLRWLRSYLHDTRDCGSRRELIPTILRDRALKDNGPAR